jgi:hypothetical protein
MIAMVAVVEIQVLEVRQKFVGVGIRVLPKQAADKSVDNCWFRMTTGQNT